MIQAEQICLEGSDHRLYFAVGYSLIQAIKSMATFEPDDLEDAIQCCRNTIHIAQLLRKHDYGILARVGSIAKGSASVASVRSMTVTQRHAELVYSECTLLKVPSPRSMWTALIARLISLRVCRRSSRWHTPAILLRS